MMNTPDPREPQKQKRKKNWVKVMQEAQIAEAPEPDRIVGRNIAYNVKSTTPASCAPAIKTSANDALNTDEKEKSSGTDPEVYEKLKVIQEIFESGQRDTNARLDKLSQQMAKQNQAWNATVARLKSIEENDLSLKVKQKSLEKDNFLLIDKAHTYKLLSIISTTLFVVLIGISLFIRFYNSH